MGLRLGFSWIDCFFRCLIEWRKLTQFLHDIDNPVRNVIYFRRRIETTQAEADGTVRHVITHAERLQYIGWFDRR